MSPVCVCVSRGSHTDRGHRCQARLVIGAIKRTDDRAAPVSRFHRRATAAAAGSAVGVA